MPNQAAYSGSKVLEGSQRTVKAQAAVTTDPDAYVTSPVQCHKNGAIGFDLDLEFGTATEIIVEPQRSNDNQGQWRDLSEKGARDVNDRSEMLPSALSYTAANWAGRAVGGVVHVALPILIVPESHWVRLRIYAVGPDAATKATSYAIGGTGL